MATIGSFGQNREISLLRAKIGELGGLAEAQLSNSLLALQRRDAELALCVAEKDVGLDERAAEIDEDAAQILAYRQPLAQGLREAIAAIRIAPTLERIGDLSKNIARRAEALSSFAPKQIELSVTRLGQSVKVHLSQSLDAFSSRDSELAMRLREKDAEIDEQFNALFRDLMYEMSQNSRSIGLGVHLMFISKNLERIGDHSTFISELTYYVSVGQAPKVERQKGRPNAQKLV